MKTRFEDSLLYQIHQTSRCFDMLFEQFFHELNIGISSFEHMVLIIIQDIKKCCMRDIAKITLKDRANIGKITKALEEKGLININLDTKNNRPVKTLTLTKAGKKLNEKIEKIILPLIEKIHSEISQEKIENLKTDLNDLRKIVTKAVNINI